MPYIFSTLTCDQVYHDYDIAPNKDILPAVKHRIFIKGGHGVAGEHLITPNGVMTKITDEEYAILQTNKDYLLHVKNGFIKVTERAHETGKITKDMELKDKSSPLTPNDYSNRVPSLPGSEDHEKPKPSKRVAA